MWLHDPKLLCCNFRGSTGAFTLIHHQELRNKVSLELVRGSALKIQKNKIALKMYNDVMRNKRPRLAKVNRVDPPLGQSSHVENRTRVSNTTRGVVCTPRLSKRQQRKTINRACDTSFKVSAIHLASHNALLLVYFKHALASCHNHCSRRGVVTLLRHATGQIRDQ